MKDAQIKEAEKLIKKAFSMLTPKERELVNLYLDWFEGVIQPIEIE